MLLLQMMPGTEIATLLVVLCIVSYCAALVALLLCVLKYSMMVVAGFAGIAAGSVLLMVVLVLLYNQCAVSDVLQAVNENRLVSTIALFPLIPTIVALKLSHIFSLRKNHQEPSDS